MATDDDAGKARKAELAEAFADGLTLFESRKAEETAKANAANPPKEGNDDGNGGDKTPTKRTVAEWLLG